MFARCRGVTKLALIACAGGLVLVMAGCDRDLVDACPGWSADPCPELPEQFETDWGTCLYR